MNKLLHIYALSFLILFLFLSCKTDTENKYAFKNNHYTTLVDSINKNPELSEPNMFSASPNELRKHVVGKENDALLKYTNGIRAILHDSKGNYWFGSHQEGVALFDGKSYTYFKKSDGLSDSQVRTIQEDQNGTIWFGCASGVSSYKDGVLKDHTARNAQYGFNTLDPKSWAIAKDDLWFAAGNAAGIYRAHKGKISYHELPEDEEGYARKDSYAVTANSKGSDGILWIATYSAAFGYDGTHHEIISEISQGYKEQYLHIRSILADSKGNVWIGNNGIGVLQKTENQIINFSEQLKIVHPMSMGTGDTSPAGTMEHVFAIAEDQEGNIWFGDRDTGAWRYDGVAIKNYTVDPKLKSQHIWQIYQDNNGALLFAMGAGGVYKFNEEDFDRVH